MRNRRTTPIAGIALVCLGLVSNVALAEEKPPVKAPDASVNPFGAAVKSETLARQRGGTDGGPLSDMKLSGVVTDNRATNVVTGANIISDNALANASGMPMVVQNSGNNVLIQNATIVNVQLK